jgi:putative transposase
MDFVQDALFNGSRFRILSIVDNYSKKCLALAVGQSMKGADVVDELERLHVVEGVVPERIQCDNGSEFISKEVDRWAYEHSVTLDF